MAKAQQIRTKHPDESRNGTVSFHRILETGEILTGTPTVTFTPAGLTVNNVQINTGQLTIEGETVPIGTAVQFTVVGGTDGQRYTGQAQCATTSGPAQSLVVVFELIVSDSG